MAAPHCSTTVSHSFLIFSGIVQSKSQEFLCLQEIISHLNKGWSSPRVCYCYLSQQVNSATEIGLLVLPGTAPNHGKK